MINIILPMRLPSLNEYIKECNKNRYGASKYKATIEEEIGYFLNKVPKLSKPIILHLKWTETTRKRDLDNIAVAKKFILDAMVKKSIIKNDTQRWVRGFTDTFEIGEENKIQIKIEEIED